MSVKIFNAALYVRLSKEDGDKSESDSITNQRELIKDFLKSMPEIRLCSERVDDGFSGASFSRPAFKAMLEDVKEGKINCIIVKDFSRFGRNYIEVGRYLENVFPFLGVRFISINDNYDTANKRSDSDDLIVPFKNLINDAYLRDISVKVRSQLAIKRKKGDFIGNFTVYGYMKSSENKNKLIVDEYAAEVVRDIFRWKIEGYGQQGIAEKLNERGELSPMEYKLFNGQSVSTSFRNGDKAVWTAPAIIRILTNPVYTGVLEQGKTTTPNHKLKNRIVKPKDEWSVHENAHEAIISEKIFDVVAGLMSLDTRSNSHNETVYPFAGLLYCADCGSSMTRKTVPSCGKKYIYYVCGTNKKARGCTSHSTSEIELTDIVLTLIQKHIANVLSLEEVLPYVSSLSHKEKEAQKLSAGLSLREDEINKYKNLKASVYEDFKDGILDGQEYSDFNALYSAKLTEVEAAAERLRKDIEKVLNGEGETEKWIAEFKQYRNITELTRKVMVSLIERIKITDDGIIDITFKYRDKFQVAVQIVTCAIPIREVV
ncbi:MAG: recombinase family protein [Oscillospiraceae bacterium]|jgi:DNA invertase Pin-like site-specific DNA recombinase|nr:recombinase family protein [Oscillospiraceae bacterium]